MTTLMPPSSFALMHQRLPAPPFSGRVAVLGAGAIGRRHLTNLANAGIRDLAVYDPAPDVLDLARAAHDVHAVGSLETLWRWKPEIVFVCAPTSAHLALAQQAVASGAHLFVEKPLDATLDGWTELAGAADAQNLVTMTACNMRFHPGPQRLRRWLATGAIGSVLCARIDTGSVLPHSRPGIGRHGGFGATQNQGDAILDSIHEIDLALWLLGSAQLHAALVLPDPGREPESGGLAELLLRHASGTVSSLRLDFLPRNRPHGIEIVGENGVLRWERGNGIAEWRNADGALCEYDAQPESWRINAMYEAELACFLDACVAGRPTFSPIRDGMAALEIALQARTANTTQAATFPTGA